MDYAEAQRAWMQQGMSKFKDYVEFYCQLDVDVLIEGLVNYRKILMKESNLDVLDFVSISQIAYHNALNGFSSHWMKTTSMALVCVNRFLMAILRPLTIVQCHDLLKRF